MRRLGAGRRPAIVALLICLCAGVASSCSGSGGGSDSVTPEQVNQFVLVREASDDMTHLLNAIRVADAGVVALEQRRPGSARWRDELQGEQLAWSQVLTDLNMFNQAQGALVPQVETAIGQHKDIAIHWLSALVAAQKHAPTSKQQERKQWDQLTKGEQQARQLLKAAALGLSKKGCALGTAHRSLMSARDLASMCAAAKALSAPPSS